MVSITEEVPVFTDLTVEIIDFIVKLVDEMAVLSSVE